MTKPLRSHYIGFWERMIEEIRLRSFPRKQPEIKQRPEKEKRKAWSPMFERRVRQMTSDDEEELSLGQHLWLEHW